MLTDKELEFIKYWEENRILESSFSTKMVRGFPMAALFGLSILVFIVMVYFLFPNWFTKISNTSPGTFVVTVIAVLIAIFFFSYYRMQFKWEMNEQTYKELIHRQQKELSDIDI